MRRLTTSILAFEIFAIGLAFRQMELGVRTDEAKYLLDIPYPHPPLARWLLSLLDGFVWQEMAARILFATLLVQAAWLVWSIGKKLHRYDRYALVASWLLAWGVVSQAGTIMMAPLTALQGLVFLWFYLREEEQTASAGIIALFWLASLFTAYQAALFAPIVFTVFWKMRMPAWRKLMLFALPVLFLCAYTLTNPFALASMLHQAGKDAVEPLAARFSDAIALWFVAGSGVASIAGTYGLVRSRRWPLLLTFCIVCAYILAGFHDYYAVLLVPFFIVGALFVFKEYPSAPLWYAPLLLLAGFAFMVLRFPFLEPAQSRLLPPLAPATPAREVMRMIGGRHGEGNVLIQGSFGHEWQYESPYPVLKYGEWLLEDAQAVVCLTSECDVRGKEGFEGVAGAPVEVWMRK